VRAIDTNIVVRALAADDPVQTRQASVILDGGDIFIPVTVLLESEWVLRNAYEMSPATIVAALRRLAGLDGILLEDPVRVDQALDWTEQGMDFADALHLARADDCSEFLSFDRKLAKIASKVTAFRVTLP